MHVRHTQQQAGDDGHSQYCKSHAPEIKRARTVLAVFGGRKVLRGASACVEVQSRLELELLGMLYLSRIQQHDSKEDAICNSFVVTSWASSRARLFKVELSHAQKC